MSGEFWVCSRHRSLKTQKWHQCHWAGVSLIKTRPHLRTVRVIAHAKRITGLREWGLYFYKEIPEAASISVRCSVLFYVWNEWNVLFYWQHTPIFLPVTEETWWLLKMWKKFRLSLEFLSENCNLVFVEGGTSWKAAGIF